MSDNHSSLCIIINYIAWYIFKNMEVYIKLCVVPITKLVQGVFIHNLSGHMLSYPWHLFLF